MDHEMRLKMFVDEYRKIVQVFDDIVSMKESMGRLEKYMIIMVVQVMVALVGGAIFMCIRFFHTQKQRGEYELEHRFERGPSGRVSAAQAASHQKINKSGPPPG